MLNGYPPEYAGGYAPFSAPPMVYQLRLKGLNRNADGLYSLEDVNGRFEKAITAYDDIK